MLNEQQQCLLRTLAYYDIFHFPLKEAELMTYGTFEGSASDLREALRELLTQKRIAERQGYYMLPNASVDLVTQREASENRAHQARQKVDRYSQLIARFPFVECVCISGSYSKGLLNEEGDVDYFIIARPGKLWIARTLLILYKKIILLNSRKYFCINYLIDSDTLEIPDKNIFTATEVMTLLPMSGAELYARFIGHNQWATHFIPNRHFPSTEGVPVTVRKGVLSRFTELLFGGGFGNWLDHRCFRLTVKRWEKKFPQFPKNEFELNLRSRKNVSKHHPQGFQFKVLNEYRERLEHLRVNETIAGVA